MSLLAIFAFSCVASAQSENLEALNAELRELYRSGQHRSGLEKAKRYVALVKDRLGERAEYAAAVSMLGTFHYELGELSAAEQNFRQAVEIRERLARDGASLATDLNNLGMALLGQDRLAAAELPLKRALELREKAPERNSSDIANSHNNLAGLYDSLGRLGESEKELRRALKIYESESPNEPADIATAVYNLAANLRAQGRLEEAEPHYHRALEIRERLPANHPDLALSLIGMASLYQDQGRFDEAEQLLKRALGIRKAMVGEVHTDIALILNNLGTLLYRYRKRERLAESERYFRDALAIARKVVGSDHSMVVYSLNNLARLYEDQLRLEEAESLFKEALAIRQKALPPEHPEVAASMENLGGLYHGAGRLDEAERLYETALAIKRKALPKDHENIAHGLGNLALLLVARQEWARALSTLRDATEIIEERGSRRASGLTSAGARELVRNSNYFRMYASAAYRTSAQEAVPDEAFIMAQWAQRTAASAALSQMAARQAKGDDALSRRVRELENLERQLEAEDIQLAKMVAKGDAARQSELRGRIAALRDNWQAINRQLEKEYPEYAALVNPKPLSVVEARKYLRTNEVLVVFLDRPELSGIPGESFAWAVTRDGAPRWVRLPLSPSAIADRVMALRCGLDERGEWEAAETGKGKRVRVKWRARHEYCKPFERAYNASGLPPFRFHVAHELYEALLGQFEDMIAGKELVIVASGALSSLPLHVLVTSTPDASWKPEERYRRAQWLGHRQAITVLPSVASLYQLRELAKRSPRPTRPYLGVGNPLLVGRYGGDKSAWQKKSCKQPPYRGHMRARALAVRKIEDSFKGASVDVEALRYQDPLPETANELCAIGRTLGVVPVQEEQSIWLGARATERNIKRLSKGEPPGKRELEKYAVVHFATHGLLVKDSVPVLGAEAAEPGLVLTPPRHGTSRNELKEDDGLLTASEIAELELNADWVILSACNTAAGERSNAEPLSGLARAFFFARARSLLVSHWYVDSPAVVELMTQTFSALRKDGRMGRAEALRRSMVALSKRKREKRWLLAAHPAVWAPFVVVGEGGPLPTGSP
jgi:CHAT domain-containing protein/Tfp pilus assembly protein PilF